MSALKQWERSVHRVWCIWHRVWEERLVYRGACHRRRDTLLGPSQNLPVDLKAKMNSKPFKARRWLSNWCMAYLNSQQLRSAGTAILDHAWGNDGFLLSHRPSRSCLCVGLACVWAKGGRHNESLVRRRQMCSTIWTVNGMTFLVCLFSIWGTRTSI